MSQRQIVMHSLQVLGILWLFDTIGHFRPYHSPLAAFAAIAVSLLFVLLPELPACLISPRDQDKYKPDPKLDYCITKTIVICIGVYLTERGVWYVFWEIYKNGSWIVTLSGGVTTLIYLILAGAMLLCSPWFTRVLIARRNSHVLS